MIDKYPKRKKCARCLKIRVISNFRIRTDKRQQPPLTHINNKCKFCEAEEQRTRYKSNPEKHLTKTKEYRRLNKDKVNARRRVYRQENSERIHKNRRRYDKKNAVKIKQQQAIRGKRWAIYQKENLTDNYIIEKIKQRTDLSKQDILNNTELIMAWRTNLKLKRKLYES